jgi:hypothetical protein
VILVNIPTSDPASYSDLVRSTEVHNSPLEVVRNPPEGLLRTTTQVVVYSKAHHNLWYIFSVDPSEALATLDPAGRPAAKAETPAPEAAALLADPDKPRAEALTPKMRYIRWLTDQPEWTGPLPGEDPTPEDNDE